MRKLSKTVLVLTLITLSGIAVFLATWDMSPSLKKVERVLPDARFPK